MRSAIRAIGIAALAVSALGGQSRLAGDQGASAGLTLQPAFTSLPRFTEPVAMLQAPGDDSRWFVLERSGVVRTFANDAGVSATRVFADISRKIHTAGELEAGLLGMAFDPKFGAGAGQSRYVYLFYTAAPNSGFRLRSTISRFTANAELTALDDRSEVRLIGLDKLESNHNGGHLLFGPDGMLYAGFGEGGGEPNREAQDDRFLFGKIIRINPSVPAGRVPYSIPPDNPNAGNGACNGSGRGRAPCPEVWARGLRNPWRFSFDRADGRLWVGDVGWGKFEEIDIVSRNANYGWPIAEGSACVAAGCSKEGLIDPVLELPRSDAQSITGGHVYRGPQKTDLVGHYVFADYESKMFGAVAANGNDRYRLRVLIPPFAAGSIKVSSFAEAHDGELFALDFPGGGIRKLVFPASGGDR
jgi:glucose/arabinose dehydrogenase